MFSTEEKTSVRHRPVTEKKTTPACYSNSIRREHLYVTVTCFSNLSARYSGCVVCGGRALSMCHTTVLCCICMCITDCRFADHGAKIQTCSNKQDHDAKFT